MASLRVDTQAILQAADAFEQLHARAEEAIGAMDAEWNKEIIMEHESYWEGPASEQMHCAYAEFINKYHERFLRMIENYCRFLHQTAAEGYEHVEMDNISMSELIDEQIGVCPEVVKQEGFAESAISKVRDAFYGLK